MSTRAAAFWPWVVPSIGGVGLLLVLWVAVGQLVAQASDVERFEDEELLERYDEAWTRWAVEGLPMREVDAEALTDVRALAEGAQCELY